MKQETLEETAERLYPNGCDGTDRSAEIYRRIFIEGAKWQQEGMYSEIKELHDNEHITGFSKRAYAQCLDIVEQFKK
jgi:hypothetical protein